MNKLDLPTVTLVCTDCVDAARAIIVLEKCKALCNFAEVKLFTSCPTSYSHKIAIPPINSINEYSAWMLKRLPDYITTPHVQVVQWDGWILHPDMWDMEWLKCDYVAPCFLQNMPLEQTVGSGGFSLRSRRFIEAVAANLPPWDGKNSYDGSMNNSWGHEDGIISCWLRSKMVQLGFRYASIEQATRYAYGGNQKYYKDRTFGFHGFWPVLQEHFTPKQRFTKQQMIYYGLK